MTPKFKADVQRALDERGWTRQDLAEKLHVAKSGITNLLGPNQTSSALVPRVAELLGIDMPILGTDAELADLISKLSPEARQALVVLVRGMMPPRDRDPDKG
jgi:transcriptional regulator with XRE-family HTH domain